MNSAKKKDQNFLPDDALRLLEGIYGVIVAYRQEKDIPATRFATQAGLRKNSLEALEKEKISEKGKRRAIDLVTLVKILNRYPDLRPRIAQYLLLNNDGKLTAAIKNEDIKITLARLEIEVNELMKWKQNIEGRVVVLEKKASHE